MDLEETNDKNDKNDDIMKLVNRSYKVIRKLGDGAFSEVYLIQSKNYKINNKFPLFAVKIASKSEKNSDKRLILEYEILNKLQNRVGFPQIHGWIKHKIQPCMVMTQLGDPLSKLMRENDNSFTYKDVLMIGIQAINALENLHNIGYIHRDLKPENFLIGLEGERDIIYLIDFGLSKKYINETKITTPKNKTSKLSIKQVINKEHIEFKQTKGFVGTARYCSLKAHQGYELSRRDDIESLAYILLYFYRSKLPWQQVKRIKNMNTLETIEHIKKNMSLEEICDNVPQIFLDLINYARNLRFSEPPNYKFIKQLMFKALKKKGLNYDFKFSWIIKNIK